MLLLFITSTGCAHYYPIQDRPQIAYADIKPIDNAPTVEVLFQFQGNGQLRSEVTELYRPQVMNTLNKSGLFSKVNTGGVPSDARIDIVINNVYDSLSGAVASGCIEGFTLGLIGSSVTDDYDIKTNYTPKGKSPVSMHYKYGITSTSGLIVQGVKGVESKKTSKDAFNEVVEQSILKLLSDLKQQGLL